MNNAIPNLNHYLYLSLSTSFPVFFLNLVVVVVFVVQTLFFDLKLLVK